MADREPKVIRRDFRYAVPFEEFFELGLYQMGPVHPDTEYTGNPDRPGPQRRDPVTGLRIWRIPVADPGEPNSKRASYDVLLLSDTEPVASVPNVGPGLPPIVLEGVTVQPRIGGQGEFKYLTYIVRASGYGPAPSGNGRGAGSAGGSGSPKGAH